MKPAFVIVWLTPVWCAAVVIKLLGARSRRAHYRFAMWDGGLMLRGTELGPAGQIGFGLLAVALAAVAIWLLAWGLRS